MFFDTTEQKSLHNERKINELSIQCEKLDGDIEQLFQKLEIDPALLSQFLSQRENFSDEEWQYIEESKRQLEKELLCSIENIADPRKTRRAYETRVVQPGWLYVR